MLSLNDMILEHTAALKKYEDTQSYQDYLCAASWVKKIEELEQILNYEAYVEDCINYLNDLNPSKYEKTVHGMSSGIVESAHYEHMAKLLFGGDLEIMQKAYNSDLNAYIVNTDDILPVIIEKRWWTEYHPSFSIESKVSDSLQVEVGDRIKMFFE